MQVLAEKSRRKIPRSNTQARVVCDAIRIVEDQVAGIAIIINRGGAEKDSNSQSYRQVEEVG